MSKNYYAVIPAEVRYSNKLTANAKLLYGEITALADHEGKCTANNKYFAQLYNVSTVSISKWVSQLAQEGFLTIEFFYKKDSKEIETRVLNISLIPLKENFNTPLKKSLKNNIYIYNNTLDNNIYNNISNPPKNKTVQFSPEVENALEYFIGLFSDLKTKPNTKSKKQKWLEALSFIEKHYELKETYLAVKWARQDAFWQSNVLSLPPLIVSKNGERKLDKILAKYRSLNTNATPEPMQRIKGNWKLVTAADGKTEVQVTNNYGKTIHEFLLTQHNGYSKADIQLIKNFLS
jgi:hypothetical protein